MKKINKYLGECNILLAFGAIMDLRMKFFVIEYAYPKIYSDKENLKLKVDVTNQPHVKIKMLNK